jgi:hypothetical protein
MSFNPFFEPENMSDDELTNKLNQLRQATLHGQLLTEQLPTYAGPARHDQAN